MTHDNKNTNKNITAAIIIIGNEILSGMTQDLNVKFIANKLLNRGIFLREVAIILDIEQEIVEKVNLLRRKYDYVFTTGGIGPTHDDITSSSVAKAFNVNLVLNETAYKEIEEYYLSRGDELNEARKKMAYIPEGASLIANSVTKAPGFRIENIFVMAGIPYIMNDMFLHVEEYLEKSDPIVTRSIEVKIGESIIAELLTNLQNTYSDIDIGSYPFRSNEQYCTKIVFKGKDVSKLEKALAEFALGLDQMRIEHE